VSAPPHQGDVLDLLGRLVAEESVEGSPAIAACLDVVADRLEGVAATVERLDFDGVPALTPASVTAMPPGV
jgi:hypothetical protein